MSKPVTEDVFALNGRRNRKSYVFATLLVFLLIVVVWCVAVALSAGSNDNTGLIIAVLLSLPAAAAGWTLGAQRCRDFGWTGWAILITLIPYVGWLFAVAIMFVPGTLGPNRYGPDLLKPVNFGA